MKIALLGAGKLGGHLGIELHRRGEQLVQVFSRERAKAERIAAKTGAEACNKLEAIRAGADLYLLCVSDDAIAPVADVLRAHLPKGSLLAHCSGSQPATLLGKTTERRGVFYPLQSFTPGKEPVWEDIPFCIYGSRPEDEELLLQLARKISGKVYRINDEQRSRLHLAAVFANNFTNKILDIAYKLCEEHHIPFELLHPLILETAHKAVSGQPPAGHQTGPAVRKDQKTLQRHLQQLEAKPRWQALYALLTELIQQP